MAQGRHLRRIGGDEAAYCTLASEPDVVSPAREKEIRPGGDDRACSHA
jgi:hypothetical protein